MAELAEEEGDASDYWALHEEAFERPREAEWPEWSGYLRDAWVALRSDRFIGAMGGTGSLYYTAISRYASDHGIEGEAIDFFRVFMRALDAEYCAICAERERAVLEASKQKTASPT